MALKGIASCKQAKTTVEPFKLEDFQRWLMVTARQLPRKQRAARWTKFMNKLENREQVSKCDIFLIFKVVHQNQQEILSFLSVNMAR